MRLPSLLHWVRPVDPHQNMDGTVLAIYQWNALCIINNSEFTKLPTGELRTLRRGDAASICRGGKI